MNSIPQKYVQLTEQIAIKLEAWADPGGQGGLRNEYVGHLKPIGIALEGFDELLDWLCLNRAEDGTHVRSMYNRLISRAKLDDHLLESLYEGQEVFSEEAALGLAFKLREIVKKAEYVVMREPSEEDGMTCRLSKSIELLKEFRSTFIIKATVESEGKFPAAFLDFNIQRFAGATGILQLNFLPHTGKISCRFKPESGGDELSWIHYEKGLSLGMYEESLFSTWSYDDGWSLDKNQRSKAVWYIEDPAIANCLEDIAGRVDGLLNTMGEEWGLPLEAASAMDAVRNHNPIWKCSRVTWSYVKELDKCIRDLEIEYKRLSMAPRTARLKIEAGKPAQTNHHTPTIEEPKRPGQKSKYTPEKIRNMLTSYEKHFEERNDVKYAWNCVAEEHGIKSGKAAEMAFRRYQKKNK